MTLNGKHCIGYLQQDNREKGYFRVRPLLCSGADRCELIPNIERECPQDGFVRVVPDKKESMRFKKRMRALGRYCVLDLCTGDGERPKLRLNKNYRPDRDERNEQIVYSDAVRKPPKTALLAEVVTMDDGASIAYVDALPGSTLVMARSAQQLIGPFAWREGETAHEIELLAEPSLSTFPLEEACKHIFDLQLEPGLNVSLYCNWNANLAEQQKPAEQQAQTAEPKQQQTESITTDKAASPAAASPQEPTQETEKTKEKAWISRNNLLQRPIPAPTRRRSLSEIVDDKWTQARMDQLGHPVPEDVSGMPAQDPVKEALDALGNVWYQPEARQTLLEAMFPEGQNRENLKLWLGEQPASKSKEQLSLEQQMTALEAERLKLIGEIDELRLKHTDTRNQLMDELREQNKREVRRLEAKADQLKASIQALESRAQAARDSLAQTKSTIEGELNQSLEKRLASQLIDQKARHAFISLAHTGDLEPPSPPMLREVSAGELLSDLRIRFECAGWKLSHDEAVNLLTCLALSPILLLSGLPGSGKSAAVRMSAQVLGIYRENLACFCEIQAQPDWHTAQQMLFRQLSDGLVVPTDPAVYRLLSQHEGLAPSLLLINNAGYSDAAGYASGFFGLSEEYGPRLIRCGNQALELPKALRLILELGQARPAAALADRAFSIHFEGLPASEDWRSDAQSDWEAPEGTVGLRKLKALFSPDQPVPGEVELHLKELRQKLDKAGLTLTRRTLKAVWEYCAAVIPLMQCTPAEVLDWALSQRAVSGLWLSASPAERSELSYLFTKMPRCNKRIKFLSQGQD